MSVRILAGHVLTKLCELPDESIHCVVTSPPYYGLRDYQIEPQVWGGEPRCQHVWGDERTISYTAQQDSHGGVDKSRSRGEQQSAQKAFTASTGAFCRHCGAWRGSLGLEPTLDLYLDHMVEICREIRRVLRKDGTFWLNIGDSYAGGGGGNYSKGTRNTSGQNVTNERNRPDWLSWNSFKAKDLMLIPSRLAIRLCDDGWWVRSDIAWCKRAPMPESCTDRPTSAWEHVFLLTKAAKYFYDAEAVKEEVSGNAHPHGNGYGIKFDEPGSGNRANWSAKAVMHNATAADLPSRRNMRSFWLLGPSPYPEAHFATFPPELPRRCIMAGTSERGVCPKCSAPYARVVEKGELRLGNAWSAKGAGGSAPERSDVNCATTTLKHVRDVETIGWRATCSCEAGAPVPATVLDCFAGAGTSLMVADQLQRNAIGIELSPKYVAMMRARIEADAGMFADIAAD